MRNKICIVLLLLCVFNLNSCTSGDVLKESNSINELSYEDIADKIIRFHVIANSNTDEDQALKLKVRDKVIEFVSNKLKDSKSLEESRQFVLDNKSNIEEMAKDVINENGYSYSVTSSLSRENFPDKVYGDVVFPQGEYEAYRILIGEAKGENWWCVMFPPLCFVDGTKDAIDSTEVVNEINNSNGKEKVKNNKIEFKSKLFEMLFEK